ncbi:MAG: glutamate racemase [Bdellovibrionia bacterium]
MSGDSRPIGVFDSGIGGLTVLRELVHAFPQESFLYLGDTARLPYGSKSAATIRKYTEQNMDYFIRENVKAIVIACNSASAQFMEPSYKDIPVYNVIEPGAQVALAKSQSKRIGVLATRATVQSKAYTMEILKHEAQAQVFDIACPLFVPLAEEGWDADPVTNLIVYRYVSQILPQHVDTIILGCTHYPLLRNSIERVTGNSIALVDSGEAVTQLLLRDFANGRIKAADSNLGAAVKVCTTDFSEHFNNLALRILRPLTIDSFEVVSI